jgi:hypothetical protein
MDGACDGVEVKEIVSMAEEAHRKTFVYSWVSHGESSRSSYRWGYLKGARQLAKAMGGVPAQDNLVYPMIFLYRHYVELEIKDAIDLCLAIVERNPMSKSERDTALKARKQLGHDLRKAWHLLMMLASREFEQSATLVMEECQPLIEQLASLDHSGEAFRYPLTVNGKAVFPKSFEMNLASLDASVGNFERLLWDLHTDLRQGLDPEASESDLHDSNFFW